MFAAAGPLPRPLVPSLPTRLAARRPFRAPVTDDEHRITPGPASAPSCARAVAGVRLGTSGSSRSRPPASATDTLLVDAPPSDRARGSPTRFGRLLRRRARAAVLGPGAQVDSCVAGTASATPHAPEPRSRPDRGAARADDALQPEAHVRPVRHRRRQPLRPRRRASRRRDARARLQPALHLRPAGRRQDPPAALDRQLRHRVRRRLHRSLHDRRGVHEPLRRRAARQGASTRFKAAYRGVDVLLVDDVQFLQAKAQHRGGVLPHLQRAAPGGRADRAHLRPPAARPRRPRAAPARALRGRPRHGRRAPQTPRHAAGDPAQARPARRHRLDRPRGAPSRSPSASPTTSARSRAR